MISVTDIRTFVELQRGLLGALAEQSAPMADGHHNAVVELKSERWNVSAHGLGYEFRRERDGLTVDAHTGVACYPRVFDAWRLLVYLDTRPGNRVGRPGLHDIEETLQRFCVSFRVQPAPLDRHYMLTESNHLRSALTEVRDHQYLASLPFPSRNRLPRGHRPARPLRHARGRD